MQTNNSGNNRLEAAQAGDQNWVPIVDYAVMRGVSTSTLRRYIKANKIPYKVENGRYLLLADKPITEKPPYQARNQWQIQESIESISVFQRVRELEQKLARTEEQLSEMKMLVSLYEEKLAAAGH